MWNALSGSVKKRCWYLVHALTGVHLSTSIYYRDWSMMRASFRIPVAKIEKKIPSGNLKPFQLVPGTAIIVFNAMEMRKVSGLSPYNEFSIEVPVIYEAEGKGERHLGSYVLYMPVTTEGARWGGVEIYGLPKFLAKIHFEDEGEVRRCRVQAEAENIITLEVKKLVTEPQSWELYLYGVRDGQLLRTLVQIQGQQGTTDVRGGASYTLGSHPIAEELRSLEIDNLSITHEYAPQLQGLEKDPPRILHSNGSVRRN